jgi:hypothetical protein
VPPLAPLYPGADALPLLADPQSRYRKLKTDPERLDQIAAAELLLGLEPPAYTDARKVSELEYAVALILRDTDHLFKTLFRARSADSRLRLVPGGIRLALNVGVRYAIFHQLGTENMPVRQVIPDPLPGVFIKRIRSLVKEFILTGKAA